MKWIIKDEDSSIENGEAEGFSKQHSQQLGDGCQGDEAGKNNINIYLLLFVSLFQFMFHSVFRKSVQKLSKTPHCQDNTFPIFNCSFFISTLCSRCSCCPPLGKQPTFFLHVFHEYFPFLSTWRTSLIIISSQMLSSSWLEFRVNRTIIETLF